MSAHDSKSWPSWSILAPRPGFAPWRRRWREVANPQPKIVRLFPVVLSLAVTIIIIYSRWSDAIDHPQLWAEDGQIFFVQEREFGFSAFCVPFAGYLHFIPRLTAYVAAIGPAAAAPGVYLTAAVFTTLWTALTIATLRLPWAPAYAATLMIAPHSGEVFGTITNAQWISACALPLLACDRQSQHVGVLTNQMIFLFICGLSGPFSIWAAPFFLVRLRSERRRGGLALCAMALATAAVQGFFVWTYYVPFVGERYPLHLGMVLLDRWIGGLSSGWRTETTVELLKATFLGSTITLAVLTGRFRNVNRHLLIFALTILGATWIKFMPGLSMHMDWPSMDDRYLFIPRVMAIWMLMSCVLAWSWPTAVPAVLSLAMMLTSYRIHDHDFWTKRSLPRLEWTEGADRLDAGIPVDIPINPEPYHVKVP